MQTIVTRHLALVAFVYPATAFPSEWTQFRGSSNNGVAIEKLPVEWGPNKNVLWKVEIPGVAWSSQIVSGDKDFVTTAITENQLKPGGYGGGRGPGDGRGAGRFTPSRAGEFLPAFFHGMLNVTDEQGSQLTQIQQEVDDKLAQLLKSRQEIRSGLRESVVGVGDR